MFFLKKDNILLKIKEIKKEIRNISWSDGKEITQTILIIFVLIFITSVFLWIIDSLLVYIIAKLI